MVAAMRRDWDATGSLPIEEAHRVHLEHGRAAGSRSFTGTDLAAHRDAVIERAQTQRDP